MFTEWVEGGKTSSICGRVETPMASVDKTKTKIKKFFHVFQAWKVVGLHGSLNSYVTDYFQISVGE